MAHLHDLKLPLLSFHSEKDTMTDPDGSRALMERASSSDKQLHWVNDMWHIITKEKGNERLRDDIMAWVGERCK
jgi:acylglycerol lipase